MIRSIAARTLSARQKSTIRSLGYRLGAYVPRQVERMVENVAIRDRATTFLQIGANDGYLSDPLNLAIFRHRLAGTFVEPQANYLAELRKTYAGFPGMTFVPCAISAKAGRMTMYTLDCSSGRLPRWAHGVGTLSHEQILKFGDQIDAYIRAAQVDCITVPQLLERMPAGDPDIIAVDAEGFDYEILSQFDFAALSTTLVIYETESMRARDAAALALTFADQGFAIIEDGQDTLALRRSSVAYRTMPRVHARPAA